jgi:PAS domain S-box-containing protein
VSSFPAAVLTFGVDVTLFVGQASSRKRQYASQAAGFVAVAIAVAALIGLWTGLPLLSSWGSGFPAVRPVGALGIVALGLALIHPGKDSRVAFAVGLAAAALAVLGLVLVLFNVELGIINRWLAPRAVVSAPSFRVASAGAVAFGLVSGSLALSRFERHRFAATVLGGLAGVIVVFALLGYLTGIDTLYGSLSVNSPPLPTAVGLLCVAGGIILRIGAMPAFRKPRPLWRLLVMLGCAIVAPLLLFGAYAGFRIAAAQLHHVREDLTIAALTLSADVDREIIGEIERLQALAGSPSLRQGDFAEFQHQAAASLALRRSGNIMLIDRDMQQLVDTLVPFGTPLQKAAVPEPTLKALATGQPQVTGLFVGSVTKRLVFAIIVPVQIDRESRYALVRSPNQHALVGRVDANKLRPGWRVVVSDATHRIVARSEHQNAFMGKELPPAQWHGPGPGGVFEFIDSEGQPSLEAYASSELTGWETAVWAPKALLEAPVQALWWTLGVTALLAFTLVVALALWLGRTIAGSVGHAARAAIALGDGQPLLLSETPVAEVDTLMAELRETAAKRKAAEDLLRDSERQLRLVTDNAPVSIAYLDTQARYKFINRRHTEQHGLTPEQIIGKRVPEVIGDKAFAIVEPYIRESLAGKAVEFEVEVPYQAGESQFVHCCFEPEWRDGKVVGLVSATTDIADLKRAEAALRESEATFRAMFEISSVGKIEVEPESGSFLRANAAMCKFVGYSEEELLARTLYDITHPDERDRNRELLRRLVAGESAVFDVEKRYIRKDGNTVWARVTVNVIRDGSGRALRATGVILDITERKEREEKEHLLVREINHRAKNMLSVVHAIAHQTATRNPEDFVERFAERIQALSANQDLLVRSDWNGVEIDDLVHVQLAHFAGLIGSRIAAHGAKLRLKAASAQAIGLALHELATNAGKYGALSTDRGRVDVYWRTDGDTLTMSWTERDGPLVSAPVRCGFGTTVMKVMTERSVGGAVDLEYVPSGLTWRLTCPAANALEPWECAQISGEGGNRADGATGKVNVIQSYRQPL